MSIGLEELINAVKTGMGVKNLTWVAWKEKVNESVPRRLNGILCPLRDMRVAAEEA